MRYEKEGEHLGHATVLLKSEHRNLKKKKEARKEGEAREILPIGTARLSLERRTKT